MVYCKQRYIKSCFAEIITAINSHTAFLFVKSELIHADCINTFKSRWNVPQILLIETLHEICSSFSCFLTKNPRTNLSGNRPETNNHPRPEDHASTQ